MIIDATLANMRKCVLDRVLSAYVVETDSPAPQQPEEVPLREFWGAAKPAICGIDGRHHARGQIGEKSIVEARRVGCCLMLAERSDERFGVVGYSFWFGCIDPRDLAKNMNKGGLAKAGCLRKVGTSPEGPCITVEEHRERPSAMLTETVQCAHVDCIDVGALL